MSFWEKVANFFNLVKVRNRDEDGRYVADDKSTSKNEAYKYVHKSMAPVPKKRGRPAKKKVGRPKKDS